MNFRNHRMAFVAALAGFAMLSSGNALAGNTNTLRVTADITGTCNFSASNDGTNGNTTMNFGTLDQVTGGDVAAPTTTLSYWCTNGTAATGVTAGNGQNSASCGGNNCLTNGSDFIPYSLIIVNDTQTGAGKSTDLDIDISGGILEADYIDAEAGNYSDLVTLTITP